MKRAQAELLNYDNTGMSVMELSHRSKTFGEVLARTKANLKELMCIPDNYEVIFMQGGATTQFAAIFYNLVAAKQIALQRANKSADEPIVVDYLVTGSWSNKAAQEASRLAQGTSVRVNRALDTKKATGAYGSILPASEWQLSDPQKENVAYVYYCDNETVHGVEWQQVPDVDPNVPIVADMSSNFLSKPVDVSRFGVIYGGAQKNLGPAGVTLVIIRKDLIADLSAGPLRPVMLDYRTMVDNDSMYNTPPTFAIYMVGLTLEWLLEVGGLQSILVANERKAEKLYKTIDNSNIFKCPVEPAARSRMNVVFRLANEDLEKQFLKGAEERNMVQLKGHRSVGMLFCRYILDIYWTILTE